MFDGGTSQLLKFPKVRANPTNPTIYSAVSLGEIARGMRRGLLDAERPITMKDLRDGGVAPKRVRWGVKLLAAGCERLPAPVHLQVSAASAAARRAVEAAGGSVTTVYYNALGLRALLKPELFERRGRPLPRAVRAPPPRLQGRFDAVGALPPALEVPALAPPAAV
jgi:large subunit ribosomal protein L15